MCYPLTEYIERAMAHAEYSFLEEDSFGGRIPPCIGVFAFGKSLTQCQEELRSVLEGWILLGLQLRHPLPVIDGIDLNPSAEIASLASASMKR